MSMRLASANPFSGLEEFVAENVPLAKYTWYRIGGPARWLIRPRTPEELQAAAVRCTECGLGIYVLGLGANLLVDDAGVEGAVFRLDAEHWQRVKFQDERVEVGAGVDLQKLIVRAIREGMGGLDSLAGIPASIGGAVRMNAGGKFGDIGALVQRVPVMDREGTIFERTKDDLVFDYRQTNIAAPFILGATLQVEADDPERILRRVKEVWMYKQNTQPLNTRNAGSVFKNPRGLAAGFLIDQAGLKGMRVGGAEVSQKHANFVIAHPGCTAADVRGLIKLIRQRVRERGGIELELELQMWP